MAGLEKRGITMSSEIPRNRLTIEQTRQYADTILNSLSAHIAIIDETGLILQTNLAWRNFASQNRLDIRPEDLKLNYLEICDAAKGDSAENAHQVAEGIRRVIRGEMKEFTLDYPCHSPEKKRWFYMRATRAFDSRPVRVVISHENITDLKLAEEKLRRSQEELRQKSLHLEEANAALRAVLRQGERDREEMEDNLAQNLRRAVLPYAERLLEAQRDPENRKLAELLEAGLKDVFSPFLEKLSRLPSPLTPQEMQVAHLVREGQTSKDIAEVLHVSVTTVNFHRRNLRRKLGLINSPRNLRTHLLTIME